jgi:hypothetical protein
MYITALKFFWKRIRGTYQMSKYEKELFQELFDILKNTVD